MECCTSLNMSIKNNHLECFNKYTPTDLNWTLYYACCLNAINIVRHIICNHIDVIDMTKLHTTDEYTCLMLCAHMKYYDCFDMLFNCITNMEMLDVKNRRGHNLLSIAKEYDRKYVIDKVLSTINK